MEFVNTSAVSLGSSSTQEISTSLTMATSFRKPVKTIYNQEDLKKFQASTTYHELLQFIQLSAEAIRGFEMPNLSSSTFTEASELSSSSSSSTTTITTPTPIPTCSKTVITDITSFLTKISSWVDEIPPIQQPMRFGNKAFRDWHARLMKEAPLFLASYLQEHTADRNSIATCELEHYLCTSFGHETRIDYGTGHETNFLVFLFCLVKLEVLKQNDLRDMMTYIFRGYIEVMRKLQEVYLLEPAGMNNPHMYVE